jgi:quinol monooxygenase YgiN
MTVVHMQMSVIPEKRKEFFQTIRALVHSTREEKGCIGCRIYQDMEVKNSISIIEEWKTEQDLATHIQSEHFSVLRGAINLLSKKSEIKFNTVSRAYTSLKIFEAKFMQSAQA